MAGACGTLIGYGVVDVQCGRGARPPAALQGADLAEEAEPPDCALPVGLGMVGGGFLGAGGVAVVAVLVLRAMGEWRGRGPGPPG